MELTSRILRFQLTLKTLQMFNKIVNVPVHRSGDVAAAVMNAVISDAVLRKIVGADLFGAVAGADQGATLGG